MSKDIIKNSIGVGILDEQPVFKIFDTETGWRALLIVDDDADDDCRFAVLHFKDPETGELDCFYASEKVLSDRFDIDAEQIKYLLEAE